jgi:chromosome partitioning protein
MSSKTPVIAFVSPKGGVGKTTAALTLTSELLFQMQKPVTLIDADPNYPFKRWEQLGHKPDLLNIVFDENEETILDNIEAAKANSSAVIVDLEGTKNMRVGYAVSVADLVVIPMQPSALDANEAVEAIKLVKQTERGFKRRIDFAILLTRQSPIIKSKNFNDIYQQLTANNVPVLPSNLIEREAYRTMFSTGFCLHDLEEGKVSGLGKAWEDAYTFAEAVINRIKDGRKAAQSAAA